jgi:hypothetical protein
VPELVEYWMAKVLPTAAGIQVPNTLHILTLLASAVVAVQAVAVTVAVLTVITLV